MAAGLGTRLHPFTSVMPKPLLPVMGVPMLQFCLDQLTSHQVNQIAVNYHHLPDVFLKKFDELIVLSGIQVNLSDESKCLLGSAGGIVKVRHLFEGQPFFLMNADMIQTVNLKSLAETHKTNRKKNDVWITLALIPPAPRSYSYREILTDAKSGLVTGLGQPSKDRQYYSGVAVVEHQAIAHLIEGHPADFVSDVLEPALLKNKVGFFLAEQTIWMDIGSPLLWWEAHLTLRKLLSHPQKSQWISGIQSRIQQSCGLPTENEGYYYWIGSGEGPERKKIPKDCVLYADESTDWMRSYSKGIGFRDIWVSVD